MLKSLLILALVAVPALASPKVGGRIVDTFEGELTPYVGDLCVTFLHNRHEKLIYVLAEDYDDCSLTRAASRNVGKVWSWPRERFTPMERSFAVSALENYRKRFSRLTPYEKGLGAVFLRKN